MVTTIIANITTLGQLLPFTGASWFTIGTLFFFVILFRSANNNPANPVRWEHLIIDSQNNRASPYKVGYLVGVIVATWVVIRFADTQALNYDIFGLYLTYLVTGAGVNLFIKSRDGVQDRVETTTVQTTSTAVPHTPAPLVVIPVVVAGNNVPSTDDGTDATADGSTTK